MRKFEDQLSRMQSLMTYGMLVNEGTDKKGSFEYHRLASDGKAYGIFKECSKYYIKSAPAEKENLSEAYDYIGGWNNRKDYEYDSYAMALKQFDLKMMSINEAYGAKANATTLDPSKKGDLVIEGTEKMRAEIARQRQIMFNTATIIREGSYIGTGDPERVSGNNDADKPYTQKGEAKLDKDMPKAKGDPDDQSEPYGDGSAPEKGKDVKDGDVLSNGKAVAADHPSGGEVTHVKNINEDCENCAPNGARDWGTEGIGKGNGDPKENGWEMEGQEYVNEEINDAKEWDDGLPGSAGTGEADTDHNNDPYKENINEDSWDDQFKDKTGVTFESKSEGDDEHDVEGDADGEEDVEGGDEEVVDGDAGAEDLGGEESFDLGGEEGGEEDIDLGDDEFGDEEYDEEDGDLEAEIAALRAEVEALKAQVGGEEAPAEPEPEPVGDKLDAEEVPAEPVGDELGGEEAPAEPVGDELGGMGGEEVPEEPSYAPEEDVDERYAGMTLQEAKKAYMDNLVNSVVGNILAEEKTVLHDFGKHPGYRKKPMDLPPTGSDNVDGKKDWNDDSVHSEEPFGKTIGDGKPYDKLVQVITDSIMEDIKKKM